MEKNVLTIASCGCLGRENPQCNDVEPLLPAGAENQKKFSNDPDSEFERWREEMEAMNVPVFISADEFKRKCLDDENEDVEPLTIQI